MKKPHLTAALAALIFGAGAAGAAEELNLFAWSEYVPQKVIRGFTKETGIKVNYEEFASCEEMIAKINAGGTAYDVIQPSDYAAEALAKENLLLPLDPAKIPNAKNLLPEYLGLPHDPHGKFTVPYMIGSVGIVVNTQKIKDPVAGYNDLFSGKYKNRIVVVDDARELLVAALYTLGKSINDITPENIELARPILKKWLSQVKIFDSDSPKNALRSGEADIGLVWSGEAALLWRSEKHFEGKKLKVTKNENKKFQYVLASEGHHIFVDTLAIPKTAKNPDAAHKFINYILRPDVSRLVSAEFPYTNPNAAARKLLSPDELANPASYPASSIKPDTFRDLGAGKNALVDKLYTDLKADN
ncbi:MAG: spermidine/putrescine ABC transporter substrate-binding protein [Opitutaceae bacterium]|jgi:spermidine/putrescine transport system substrate-binding protein|nr:spermidine/putrescine ABC transporter substrate-binding protein [Opitutaceae bacterium]